MRELLLDCLGHAVGEAEVDAGVRAAVLGLDRAAGFAFARPLPVVLAHLDEVGLGHLAQAAERLGDVGLGHLVVGEAELVRLALAADERVPVGVRLEMDVRRQDLEKGVVGRTAPLVEVEAVVAPEFGRDEGVDGRRRLVARRRGVVDFGADFEERVETVEVVGLAVLEARGEAEVRDGQVGEGARRVVCLGRRPPAHADKILEVGEDGVERSSLWVAGQHESAIRFADQNLVVAPAVRRVLSASAPGEGVAARRDGVADEEGAAFGSGGFGEDGKCFSRDATQRVLELAGGGPFHGRRCGRYQDCREMRFHWERIPPMGICQRAAMVVSAFQGWQNQMRVVE